MAAHHIILSLVYSRKKLLTSSHLRWLMPMEECVAYGNFSVSQSFPGGVIKGQQTMEDDNDAYVYECIESLNISISI